MLGHIGLAASGNVTVCSSGAGILEGQSDGTTDGDVVHGGAIRHVRSLDTIATGNRLLFSTAKRELFLYPLCMSDASTGIAFARLLGYGWRIYRWADCHLRLLSV